MCDFTGGKSKPLSSSRIVRISQLKQKPKIIFHLDMKYDVPDDPEEIYEIEDNHIQIQVTDFEDKLLLINVK